MLADCLAHAIDLGAERLVDLATLTGAIVVALGDAYAGLFANDDAWATEIRAAGERTGERVWRHAAAPGVREDDRGPLRRHRQLRRRDRGGGAITAAEFLHRFAGDVPWAHLDIAGTALRRRAAPTRPRAARAGACACSSSSPAPTPEPRTCTKRGRKISVTLLKGSDPFRTGTR